MKEIEAFLNANLILKRHSLEKPPSEQVNDMSVALMMTRLHQSFKTSSDHKTKRILKPALVHTCWFEVA